MDMPTVPRDADRETYFLNMGPQHPSMHGVLRLLLEMQGEKILRCEPIIGYAHRAHEKMAENRNYLMFLPNSSRIDYLSGLIYNLAYCQAVEKIMGIEVPERAEHIRVITSELNRVSSHLLWFGTFLLDIGGITPFLYCFEDREEILRILERITGSRLTYSYGRFGGVTADIDDTFLAETTAFIKRLRDRMPEYHRLVSGNPIFLARCEGVGVFDKDLALRYGLTGPCLRASGIDYDVRKAEPYSIYDRFDFEVPVSDTGDTLARYHLRVAEMEQSMRIIEQAIAALPDGPIMPKKTPKRFKLAAGDYYYAVESARGQFGINIVADGTDTPQKIHLRTPSFSNLAAMGEALAGTMVADTITILGSIDIIMPEIDR